MRTLKFDLRRGWVVEVDPPLDLPSVGKAPRKLSDLEILVWVGSGTIITAAGLYSLFQLVLWLLRGGKP